MLTNNSFFSRPASLSPRGAARPQILTQVGSGGYRYEPVLPDEDERDVLRPENLPAVVPGAPALPSPSGAR